MSRIVRSLRFAAVIVIALLAYSNALDNQFVYDDGAQILRNQYIRDTSHLREIWTTNVWSFLGPHAISNYYRPVMHMVYMADYSLFGYSPRGYHATNVLIHAVNAALVLALGDALLLPALAAFGGALLFAAHPMGSEAVTWVAGVPEISYAFFFLLALFAYVRARPPEEVQGPRFKVQGRIAWLVVSALAAMLALFSKETALMLLPAIAIYEHFFRLGAFRRGPGGPARDSGDRANPQRGSGQLHSALFYLPHVAAVGVYVFMRIRSLGGFQVATNPYGVLTLPEHFFSAAYLCGKYVWKLISPAPFNIFYVFYPARSLADWRAAAGLLVVLASAAAAWRLWRRGQPLAFAFVLLALPLVPVMDMRAIGHNVFAERYLYLPMAGFCWLLAAAIAYIFQRRPALAGTLLLLVVANYALLTRSRNRDWHDDLTLYTVTLRTSPDSTLIRDNLGRAYLDGYGRPDLALAEFSECVRRAPNRAEYFYELALAYGELRRYDEALAAVDRSLALWQNYPEAYFARGDIYRDLRDFPAAEQAYAAALKIKPSYAEVYAALGALFREEGRPAEAEAAFQRALRITDLADAHLQMGLLCLDQQRYAQAEASFRHVLISEPHSVVAWYGLGRALSAEGKRNEAGGCFRAALNERKFAHPRRLGREPLPDVVAIERDLATAEHPTSI